jgi:hypothetical protein
MSVPVFADAITLFEEYRRLHHTKGERSQRTLVAEADRRLRQIDWLIRRIDRVQRTVERRDSAWLRQRARLGAKWPAIPDHGIEVEVCVEAFYYLAFSLIRALEELGLLAARGGFQITRVRNDLIEHSKKVRGDQTFVYGADLQNGPRIKPFEGGDQGLYANARELLSRLEPRLKRAIALLGAAPPLTAPLVGSRPVKDRNG